MADQVGSGWQMGPDMHLHRPVPQPVGPDPGIPEQFTPAQPPNRRPAIAVVVLLVAVIGGVVWANRPSNDSTPGSHSASTVVVTYETGGSARFGDVTMETPTGTAQKSGVDLPLKLVDSTGTGETFTFELGAFVYLSVQNGEDTGTVSCTISENGVVVSTNTAQGGFAIATCKGSA